MPLKIRKIILADFIFYQNNVNLIKKYWDKVKYIKTLENIDPKILWSAVKFSRTINSKEITFGDYKFYYNLTNHIQKELHNFDLNIGGQLQAKSIIPEDEKRRYWKKLLHQVK